jgi:hypothetical protein
MAEGSSAKVSFTFSGTAHRSYLPVLVSQGVSTPPIDTGRRAVNTPQFPVDFLDFRWLIDNFPRERSHIPPVTRGGPPLKPCLFAPACKQPLGRPPAPVLSGLRRREQGDVESESAFGFQLPYPSSSSRREVRQADGEQSTFHVAHHRRANDRQTNARGPDVPDLSHQLAAMAACWPWSFSPWNSCQSW